MHLDLNNLPQDTALLHRLVRDITGLVEHRDGDISRLRQIIKQLQRAQYGRRSERLDPDQLVLALEELDTDIAEIIESRPGPLVAERAPARRKPLPDHLVRNELLLDIEDDNCTHCGGTLHEIGESVSEMLDWIPATLRVIRIRRPKYACRQCETVAQVPAPQRIIAGGYATPTLIAHVLISKYCDHLPLYRQSQMFARQGVEIGRSTLAGWVGGACWWLDALHRNLSQNILASNHLYADDTPLPVLDPGRRRTKTGRLWVYLKLPNGRALTGQSHNYKRHGTMTLFAAFDVATGLVTGHQYKCRRRIEFLDFMNRIVKANQGREIHVILDNLNTHKPKCDRWLARHKNVHFHFTPTSISWLNQVEVWFSILAGRLCKGLLSIHLMCSKTISITSSKTTTRQPNLLPGQNLKPTKNE